MIKRLTLIAAILALSLFTLADNSQATAARCTGSKNCRACKNCHYCQHCAKEGGTCGVCKR